MAEKKEKQYVSDNAQLMAEWDWEKNTDFDPAALMLGSDKKVWWKCKKGHEWQTTVSHRSNGRRCPKCFGESKTSFPEQAIFFYFRRKGSENLYNGTKYNN